MNDLYYAGYEDGLRNALRIMERGNGRGDVRRLILDEMDSTSRVRAAGGDISCRGRP